VGSKFYTLFIHSFIHSFIVFSVFQSEFSTRCYLVIPFSVSSILSSLRSSSGCLRLLPRLSLTFLLLLPWQSWISLYIYIGRIKIVATERIRKEINKLTVKANLHFRCYKYEL